MLKAVKVGTVVLALAIALTTLTASLTLRPTTAHADSTSQAVVGMPFTGKWAWNASVMQPFPPYADTCPKGESNCPGYSSHPSVHHTPGGGDWATDLYAAEGTQVKLEVNYPTSGV